MEIRTGKGSIWEKILNFIVTFNNGTNVLSRKDDHVFIEEISASSDFAVTENALLSPNLEP